MVHSQEYAPFERVVAVVPGSELAVGPQIVFVCGTVDWTLLNAFERLVFPTLFT